ncbi:hypothetical protein A3E89_01910 [Candidatus Campbellbacteria bacterium RIFCSPHIGHO2_12_FULL_35_10]|uniref:Uncharacterized protein n=1 Tax=Candidatus Campbellbacteria bacterium RIFCSPHIGHO2_12_FULL_35_10 TaxID=1797578 RepID=A0A1F5EQD8_9BACT|nr:MAG: hypothetical protein A3E89_01910 [Candidatus Campbellbacteria bacterium RIFCSPHIGHO2_12_FULL_35_10]
MNRRLRKKNAKFDEGSKERLGRFCEVRNVIGKQFIRLITEAQGITKEIDELEKNNKPILSYPDTL